MTYVLDACSDGIIVKHNHDKYLFNSLESATEFIKVSKIQSRIGRKDKTKLARIVKIANLYNAGHTQKRIAEELNVSASTICNELWLIRFKCPELLTRK